MAYLGPVAARACGAAHVRSLFGPDHFGRMRTLFHQLARDRPTRPGDDPVREWLGTRLAKFGREFREQDVVGQRTIDPLPAWLRPGADVDYLPVRYVPYHGRTDHPTWLLQEPQRPRVLLTAACQRATFGVPTASAEKLLEAMAQLDVEVIATLDAEQQSQLTHVPDNVKISDFVPLGAVLPTCSAIVSHLGTGTLASALIHGVPHVGVNDGFQAWGEPLIGQQLTERGVGLFIADDEPDPARVAQALREVLGDPSYRRNAAQVREEMLAMPTPLEIVPQLEALAAHGGLALILPRERYPAVSFSTMAGTSGSRRRVRQVLLSRPGQRGTLGPLIQQRKDRGQRGFLVEQLDLGHQVSEWISGQERVEEVVPPDGKHPERVDLVKAVEQPPGEAGRLWIDLRPPAQPPLPPV